MQNLSLFNLVFISLCPLCIVSCQDLQLASLVISGWFRCATPWL